jgi:hypothetical protein
MLADSLGASFRRKRGALAFRMIDALIARHGRCRILDVGGTERYWSLFAPQLAEREGKIEILLSNITGEPPRKSGIFEYMTWDATRPRHLDDIHMVHSNSVIEHVGGWEGAQKFAANVREQCENYYVQTPYFWFPVEPHYRALFFHWLPESIRYRKIMKRAYATYPKVDDFDQAMTFIREIYLLDKRQMQHIFPDAAIVPENVLGLTKSLTAVRFGDAAATQRLVAGL